MALTSAARRGNGKSDSVAGIKHDLTSAAAKAGAVLRTGLHAGEEKVKEIVDVAGERAGRAHETLSVRVAERPLAYVGGAMAAGLVLGMIFARR